MQKESRSRIFSSFLAGATLVLAFCGVVSAAATQPIILSINYTSAVGQDQYIGTNMTVLMSAVLPTQAYSVSSTASSPTTLTLGGSSLGSIALPTTLYVTDGSRTWAVPHPGGNATSITFSDGQLLPNTPAVFTGSDYNLLALNPNFRVYAGTLITSGTPGSPDLFIYLGTFDSLSLNDSGIAGDAGAGDGIWSGVYNVREINTLISGGRFFGNAFLNGASSDQLQSTVTYNLDGVRPSVTDFQFKTDKANYNGILYLSSLSQGTTTFQPTNGQGTFQLAVNKRGVVVDIVIGTTPPKKLTPVYVPSGAINFNGYTSWNGDDGTLPNGVYVPDGTYSVSTYIHDLNGTTGITKTSSVKVLSMKMDISNIVLSPATVPVNTGGNADVLLLYDVSISNESGTNIRPSLQALGFNSPLYGTTTAIASNIVSIPQTEFLNAAGTVAFPFPGQDWNTGVDEDVDLLTRYRGSYPIYDAINFAPPESHYAGCYNGVPSNAFGVTNGAGATVYLGDGVKANDVSALSNPFGPAAANPTLMSLTHGYSFNITTNLPTSYRIRIIEKLAGTALYFVGNGSSVSDFENVCTPVVGFGWYRSQLVHFDQVNTVGWVQARDESTIFSLHNTPILSLDSTPPQVISSDPQDSSTLLPGNSFTASHPIAFTVQDPESSIDNSGATSISVTDPTGAVVPGTSSTNGGGSNNTASVIFTPNSPMVVGGQYKITLNACNLASLCVSKVVVFTVRDQTAPGITGVELVSATQAGTLPLTLPQGAPDGPYDTISEVWAALSMPSSTSNVISWDLSTISLERVSGSARVTIPMVRINQPGVVPNDGKIRYRLVSPITDSALYEITVQTYASASDGTLFSGPAATTGWVNPRFTTQVNASQLILRYNGTGSIAVAGTQPITVTAQSGSFVPTNANPAARVPNFGNLPPNAGFTPLVSTSNFSALQFSIGGVLQTVPFTWFYVNGNPLRATLYYDDIDLPSGVLHSDLRLFGLSGVVWSQIPAAQSVQTATNVTGNAFVLDLPNAAQAYSVYGIFYASTVANASTLPTATPLAFKSTRSFSPTHANPIYRKARFFYSDSLPKDVEVKIYDTGGTLIKSMGLGSGVKLGDTVVDPTTLRSSYYFEWDGRNDNGDAVKNGLYLVRWRVTRLDGSSDTVVKPVALIK